MKFGPMQCAWCGKPIWQPASGRTRKTCSDRCRKAMSRNRFGTRAAQAHKTPVGPSPAVTKTRLAAALLVMLPWVAMADCLLSWDPNPAEEQVTHYIADIDGQELRVNAPDTDARCSEFDPPINPHVGRHTARVFAVNDAGRSEPSATVPFGQPSTPAGVSVSFP